MKYYICEHCGNIIEYVKQTAVPVMCCGQKMSELVPGTSDGAHEKHVPVVTVNGDTVVVEVGSVEHPMVEAHYIQWIAIETTKGSQRVKLEYTDDVQKKDELIRTFYIPNTKEDIHEFFILALSNIKIGGINTDAWMVKLEQAYQKAELSFGGTSELERIKELYRQAQSMHQAHKRASSMKWFINLFK